MADRTVWRALLNPWLIVILFVVGWVPIIVADIVFEASGGGSRNASYALPGFAMTWLGITAFCSFGMIALILVHLARLIARAIMQRASRDR